MTSPTRPCRTLLAGLAIACTVFANPVSADAESERAELAGPDARPLVAVEIEADLAGDWIFASGDPTARIIDIYPEAAIEIAFNPAQWLALNLGLTFEPVLDPLPSTDRFFGNLGLYVDTLNVAVEHDGFALTAGKFHPGFGTAWDVTPGIYGTGFAEDYELAEMIGFGSAYAFDAGAAGTITLGGNVFFVDTTILSDSAFTSRGRTTLASGGPGNTERLDNFSITLDGTDIPGIAGLSWHAGYMHLEAGAGDLSDVNGFAAGVMHESGLSGGATLGLNTEITYLDGANGAGDRALYVTGGLSLARGSWHGEIAGTFRQTRYFAGGRDDDVLAQFSAGHTFDSGIDVSAGYAFTHEGGVGSHTAGLRISKSFGFEIARQ